MQAGNGYEMTTYIQHSNHHLVVPYIHTGVSSNSQHLQYSMDNLIISDAILTKLRDKHRVDRREVEQAFGNKCGIFLIDDREDHQSDPPTLWFVAPTNKGRLLKVAFIFRDGKIFLRTAYDADMTSQSIYDAKGR